jgi:peptide/nickel transport system ATP-binding protein
MVARALLLMPKMLIADEPVSMIDASLRATVLENLQQLKDEFGIYIIYITHDLTTAYQVSDDIIVLYQGSVAEAGDVDLVVKTPQHPYTRLLIGSIPVPDPERQWGEDVPAPVERGQPEGGRGCKFAPRCAFAFEPCFERAPPLFRTNHQRAVACYLYQDHPSIPSAEMDQVFVGSAAVSEQQAEQP